MIWTPHQAELISEIYSLLEPPSSPSSPRTSERSTSPRSHPHRRNTSDASSSSEEDQQSPNLYGNLGILLSSPPELPAINTSSFFLDDLRDGGTGFDLTRTSLKRSGAKAGRAASVMYVGSRQEASEPGFNGAGKMTQRHSTVSRIHPPSLMVHDGNGLDTRLGF